MLLVTPSALLLVSVVTIDFLIVVLQGFMAVLVARRPLAALDNAVPTLSVQLAQQLRRIALPTQPVLPARLAWWTVFVWLATQASWEAPALAVCREHSLQLPTQRLAATVLQAASET